MTKVDKAVLARTSHTLTHFIHSVIHPSFTHIQSPERVVVILSCFFFYYEWKKFLAGSEKGSDVIVERANQIRAHFLRHRRGRRANQSTGWVLQSHYDSRPPRVLQELHIDPLAFLCVLSSCRVVPSPKAKYRVAPTIYYVSASYSANILTIIYTGKMH